MKGPGVGKGYRGVIPSKELDALDLLSGETDMVVHAGQMNPKLLILNIWLGQADLPQRAFPRRSGPIHLDV